MVWTPSLSALTPDRVQDADTEDRTGGKGKNVEERTP